MAPSIEISIPTTSISPTSPPYTVYHIALRLQLLSLLRLCLIPYKPRQANERRPAHPSTLEILVLQHRFQRLAPRRPPPGSRSLSPRDQRSGRFTLAQLARLARLSQPHQRHNRRSNGNGPTTSARLHAAITERGNSAGSHALITDHTVWLDCYCSMNSHLHDARLHLTRRDQGTTLQKQHESSATAKISLVRAGSLIAALEEGLKHLEESGSGRTQSPSAAGWNGDARGGGWDRKRRSSLGEGELRRRKDLVINARKEKDGLEGFLNAVAANSRVEKAVASIQDKEALIGGAGGNASREGVLGKETERTRELDNQGVLQLQRQTMEDQAQSGPMRIVNQQKKLGIAINAELGIQKKLLKLTDEDADRLQKKVDIGKKRIGKIS